MKPLSQRNISVEEQERAERIQRDLEQNAKDLDARDPRNTAHAEMMSYGIGGKYLAMVAGRFGELSMNFIKLRDYIARQRAYAYNEHFNSSVNRAMSMFKLSITPRWALMAARGWARLILDRRRDLISDRPNRATAWTEPRSASTSTTPRHTHAAHINTAKQHRALALPCSFILMT